MANRLQSPTIPFFLGSNDDQLERAQPRAAAVRRKPTTATSPSPPPPPPPSSSPDHPSLSNQQILELFHNCIKLACENKINQKNTWELKLIDHISEIVRVDSGDDSETNFQKASCTLEAGVKIYSVRVDSVHSEAYKVLGGITRAALEDGPGGVPEGDHVGSGREGGHVKEEPVKKIPATSTVESSFEALNVKKLDVAFVVDPLYHQTSAQFDEGGAKGLLLNNLGVYGGCLILFDSFEVPGKSKSCSFKHNNLDVVDISFAKESIEDMVMNMRAKNEISPTLREIFGCFDECHKRSPDISNIHEKFCVNDDVLNNDKFELDGNAAGKNDTYTFNHDIETSVSNKSFSFDSTLQSHEENNAYLPYESIGQSFVNAATFSFQGLGVASKRNMWAGPDYWKFHKHKYQDITVAESKSAFTIKRRKKNNLAEMDIDFSTSLDRKMANIFAAPKNFKSLLLPANRAPCSNTLPEDCHYQPVNLVKLFLLPDVLCLGKRRRILSDDRSWQQNNGSDEALPQWDSESVISGPHEDGHLHGDKDAEELVSEPRKVNKIEVQYDKTSKQVDVHLLKEKLWDHMQETTHIPRTASKDRISFKHFLATFPIDCQVPASAEISPHLCFICLLHLANEHGLKIEDDPSLDDLSVHLPSLCQSMDASGAVFVMVK